MTPAVRVEELSKSYRVDVGAAPSPQRRFGYALRDLLRAPLYRIRHGASHSLHTEEFLALDDVSFDVARGEVLGVIGCNGAGKSTLLKILSRITWPSSGRAVIDGRVGSLLEVGTGFHSDLSGRENVKLNGAILGMSSREIARKFDDIVDFAGIARFIDTPVKRYSSGMRVRLGFAVAAFLQPEILIIDEVLAVGDVEFQRRCLGKMSEAAQSGRTVLFVSHNMGAINQLTERCILLENGKILADGPTDEVVQEYMRLQSGTHNGQITEEMHKISNGVRFRSVQLLDAREESVAMALNFTRLQLQVEFEVDEDLDEILLSVGISLLDGTQIARFWKELRLVGRAAIRPGVYAVRVEFELPLNPGPLSIWLRADRNFQVNSQLAAVPSAMTFELFESRKLGLNATPKYYQRALLPLESRWYEVEQIEA